MPKKREARRDSGSAKPKQLRKRLRKAEDQLQDARTKRDRAQARVDALSIIADEIRAQLAEVEQAQAAGKATTEARSGGDAVKPGAGTAAAPRSDESAAEDTAAKKPASTAARKRPAASKGPSAPKTTAAGKTATTRKTATAATRTGSATARRKPATPAEAAPSSADAVAD